MQAVSEGGRESGVRGRERVGRWGERGGEMGRERGGGGDGEREREGGGDGEREGGGERRDNRVETG